MNPPELRGGGAVASGASPVKVPGGVARTFGDGATSTQANGPKYLESGRFRAARRPAGGEPPHRLLAQHIACQRKADSRPDLAVPISRSGGITYLADRASLPLNPEQNGNQKRNILQSGRGIFPHLMWHPHGRVFSLLHCGSERIIHRQLGE